MVFNCNCAWERHRRQTRTSTAMGWTSNLIARTIPTSDWLLHASIWSVIYFLRYDLQPKPKRFAEKRWDTSPIQLPGTSSSPTYAQPCFCYNIYDLLGIAQCTNESIHKSVALVHSPNVPLSPDAHVIRLTTRLRQCIGIVPPPHPLPSPSLAPQHRASRRRTRICMCLLSTTSS